MMSRQKRNLLLVFLAMIVVTLADWIACVMTQPALPASMPNPNGYDNFVKAGQLLAGKMDDYRTATLAELHAYVATNAVVLAQLRVGLGRECRVPLDLDMTNSPSVLPLMRKLAFLLVANGRLAELEGSPDEAARNYLDAIRFGNAMSRGGFMINRLVGMACEVNGLTPLAKLALELSCDHARSTIAALEKLDATSVTWDEIRRAENAFIRHELPRKINPISWVRAFWEARPLKEGCLQRQNTLTSQLRLLTTELALRCYRSERGRAPMRLGELVPNNLQHVPLDPFSQQPLVYRAQGTNWLLYSIGPDGVDGGRKAAGPTQSILLGIVPPTTKRDLFYDSPW